MPLLFCIKDNIANILSGIRPPFPCVKIDRMGIPPKQYTKCMSPTIQAKASLEELHVIAVPTHLPLVLSGFMAIACTKLSLASSLALLNRQCTVSPRVSLSSIVLLFLHLSLSLLFVSSTCVVSGRLASL